ncbi:hypothetical protein SSPO_100830 [Streptomyces antimycoticus]|uniref:Uncharacterized protein n=1 Tax=Streptomyces antimycoticus TaxID=68175 RepID=A0A499UYT9_9ACTN|nr:hypothetical protein [Streptomyces antimycoticus]BBJ37484.1 hypothetical protein SSPO_002020 [Streptomyces antimycoticus]BBJ47365.1 hypothetical protein SSPO_100830 [Streptomyces antimycoticus]
MTTSDAPPAQETTLEPTAATRHLCAGVYVDERFRDLVIDEVCTAPHRRVAPSYGFDIVPVMQHAWRAAALRALTRTTVIAAIAGPLLTGSVPAAILIASGFGLLLLLRLAVLLRGVDSQSMAVGRSKRRVPDPLRAHRYLLRFLLPRVTTPKARVVKRVTTAALSLALTILAIGLLYPRQALAALLLAAALTLVYLAVGATRQLILNRILRAPVLRPSRLSGRQQAADRQQHHMCAVYRRTRHSDDEDDDLTMFTLFGDESPFIGAGELVYQWNPPIGIQMLRADSDDEPLHEREHAVPPFKAHELVEYLREAVLPLNADSRDVRLPAEVRDRVYVAETDVAVDRSLLPHHFTRSELHSIINTPESKQHHFLEIITPADGSEFVATVLLHVSLQGRTLSLSTAACVLAHTPRSFQRGEEFGHHGAAAVIWAAFKELSALPTDIQYSWRLSRYLYRVAKAAVLPRDLTRTPIRNILIGSRVSIREESSQTWTKVQLEKSDILGRLKTIEQRLLSAASDFLQARGVDTSGFNDRALKIINSGIFNFGDNNSFTNNAVGDASQVNVSANQPAQADNGAAT